MTNKVGVIILCRYDSKRLYGKALKIINNRPILEWIYLFVSKCKKIDKICIATSDEKTDDIIEDFCNKKNISCYRGSKNDVAIRFLNCAKQFDLDYAIRINGDNLFVNIDVIMDMINSEYSEFDLLTNVPGRTFPIGMSVEMLNVKFLERLIPNFRKKKYLEHVTLYFYENTAKSKMKIFRNIKWPYLTGKDFAIDTKEDFLKAIKIFEHSGKDYNNINLAHLNNLVKRKIIS